MPWGRAEPDLGRLPQIPLQIIYYIIYVYFNKNDEPMAMRTNGVTLLHRVTHQHYIELPIHCSAIIGSLSLGIHCSAMIGSTSLSPLRSGSLLR